MKLHSMKTNHFKLKYKLCIWHYKYNNILYVLKVENKYLCIGILFILILVRLIITKFIKQAVQKKILNRIDLTLKNSF